ncbi:hypothetical protein EVAR_6391_1 [Eumeta japonica]|uniref:Uncharacterized protein n=1 Tax=Eumeta variegata TaxID=151549 RepID=A0A4C1TDM2_EUMVA|nr:hypothetical protein EVAR_6391_1 [Eumeta japonica]
MKSKNERDRDPDHGGHGVIGRYKFKRGRNSLFMHADGAAGEISSNHSARRDKSNKPNPVRLRRFVVEILLLHSRAIIRPALRHRYIALSSDLDISPVVVRISTTEPSTDQKGDTFDHTSTP